MTRQQKAPGLLGGAPGAGPRDGEQPSSTPHHTPNGQVLRNSKGQVIGSLDGDTLVKHVERSHHLLRWLPGWACDLDALERAEQAGVRSVVILDGETGDKYRAALADFWQHGVKVDHGHGRQLALPLDRWQVTKAGDQEALQLGFGW